MPTIGTVVRRKTRCPRCDLPLATVKAGETLLAGCTKCRGVWVDRKIFETMCKPASTAREARMTRGAAPARLKCPICYYWMDARKAGDSEDLLIDVCRRHGAWLDANELQSILRNRRRQNAPTDSPVSAPTVSAATAAVTAASTAAAAVTPQDRSALERAGEIIFDLLDFADLVDVGDLGDAADLVGCLAEIGFSLFDGL